MSGLFDPHSSEPLDAACSAAQIEALQQLVGSGRVCDFGCGQGRVAIPLARGGAHVVAFDQSADALQACQQADPDLQTVHGDFRNPSDDLGQFDWLLCVGHTFSLLTDVDEAVAVLTRWRHMVRAGGGVVLDDLPGMLWPHVASGDWCDGVDADGLQQLIWHARDSVMTIRTGQQVNVDSWTHGHDDLLIRIWTDAAIRLAAQQAGFGPPEVDAAGRILVLRPVPTAGAD